MKNQEAIAIEDDLPSVEFNAILNTKLDCCFAKLIEILLHRDILDFVEENLFFGVISSILACIWVVIR